MAIFILEKMFIIRYFKFDFILREGNINLTYPEIE